MMERQIESVKSFVEMAKKDGQGNDLQNEWLAG